MRKGKPWHVHITHMPPNYGEIIEECIAQFDTKEEAERFCRMLIKKYFGNAMDSEQNPEAAKIAEDYDLLADGCIYRPFVTHISRIPPDAYCDSAPDPDAHDSSNINSKESKVKIKKAKLLIDWNREDPLLGKGDADGAVCDDDIVYYVLPTVTEEELKEAEVDIVDAIELIPQTDDVARELENIFSAAKFGDIKYFSELQRLGAFYLVPLREVKSE